MNNISATGQFRSDGAQALMHSVMTLDAVAHADGANPPEKAISISIQEKLPLMNGRTGCKVVVQITHDQAARFAHKLFEMIGHVQPASPTPA